MYDQVSVRITDRIAHAKKQLQPFRNPQLARIAVIVQMHAVHIFHYEIRLSSITQACIQHACDVGMIERGKNMLFAVKPFNE